MYEVTLSETISRSILEEDAANRLLVALLFDRHEEVDRLLSTPIVKLMIERGAITVTPCSII